MTKGRATIQSPQFLRLSYSMEKSLEILGFCWGSLCPFYLNRSGCLSRGNRYRHGLLCRHLHTSSHIFKAVSLVKR